MRSASLQDPVAINQIGVAALEAEAGSMSEAMAAARRAAERGRGDPTVALNAGIIGELAGDRGFALEQFANALRWNPALAGTTFWSNPSRLLSKDDVVQTATSAGDALNAALIWAYAGDTSKAAAALDSAPASSLRQVYRAVVAWREGDTPTAVSELRSLMAEDPLDWAAAGWLSRIARLSGDLHTAEMAARWALIVRSVLGSRRHPGVVRDPAGRGCRDRRPAGKLSRGHLLSREAPVPANAAAPPLSGPAQRPGALLEHEEQEAGIGSDVAPEQATGIHRDPEEPLEPEALHPSRRPPDAPAVEVEGGTDRKDQRHVQRGLMLGGPELLPWRPKADPEHIRLRGIDRIEDRPNPAPPSSTKWRRVRSGHLQPREARPRLSARRSGTPGAPPRK